MKKCNPFLFELQNVSFSYTLGREKVKAIRDLSLNIPNESLVTLSGPSGSGKSTLLNLLGLIEPMQTGKIWMQGEEILQMNENRKNQIRKSKFGFIFQQFHLIPVLSAEENVGYFLSGQNLSKQEIKERVQESLTSVGLWEHRMKKPSQLSGGQKQRTAIARAIAKCPEVIIGDEPTASLDRQTALEIMELLARMVQLKKCSIILSTHDPMIQSFAHCNFHLQDGRLAEDHS